MAILVIFGRNNTHADPVKNARGCWKLGDVVDVFDDDKPVVRPPAAPFYVVKITGVTKAQVEKYLAPETRAVTVEGREEIEVLRRRLYGLSVADIPAAIRNQLQTNRYVEVSWEQIRQYVRNKLTGVGE